jgi:hypothetical protein
MTMRDTRLKFHPVTGRPIVPLGRRRDGGLIWPVLGGSEPPNQPPPTPPAPPPTPPAPPTPPQPPTPRPPPPDKGYPENTPLAEMTVEQQAAYWKAQARKHEAEAKRRGDYDSVKAKAEQFDALEAASRTEHEKAVADARTEADKAARADERAKLGGQLVAAHLRAALTGRLGDDQITALVEGADTARFLTAADSTVDTAAVTAWVDRVAPKGEQKPGTGAPDLGQGRRTDPPAGSGVAAGAALYQARHPKPANT